MGSPGGANEAVSSAFDENNSKTKVTITSTATAVPEQKNQTSPLMFALVSPRINESPAVAKDLPQLFVSRLSGLTNG